MIDYNRSPDPPEGAKAVNVICRMVDGLGFRYYWATEGLEEKVKDYRPYETAWSIYETTEHIWALMNWVHLSIQGREAERPADLLSFRQSTLELIAELRKRFGDMREEELTSIRIKDMPFWYLINGPLADALTHVGQINLLRRMAGSPAPKANVFRGTPPGE
jgi:hypothetical protein